MAKAKKAKGKAKRLKTAAAGQVAPQTSPGFRGSADRNTVWPRVIDDVLHNPGMGFTTANAFDGEVTGYPKSTIAYWGWYWEAIEPVKGEYRWDLVDAVIEKARGLGQRTAIRLMPTNGGPGVPQWYRDMGAAGFEYLPEANVDSGETNWMPDHNDPNYLRYMGRMIEAFGKRYDGHPDVDHVDIRSLGHWGEWHFAFVKPTPVVKPRIRRALVDIYTDNFKETPLVIPIGAKDELRYAVQKGCGYRADCLGDMGFWGPNHNHMRDLYQQALDDANANDAWKTAPAVFESCHVEQRWADDGFDVEFIFNEALRWHCSVLNNKSSAIPPRWWGATERFLKRMGYRFVLRSFTHPLTAKRGTRVAFETEWENLGVAPPYRYTPIVVELRTVGGRGPQSVAGRFTARQDVRKWLPGRYDLKIQGQVSKKAEPGRYHIAVAMLDTHTQKPAIQLAVEGRDAQGWYSVSEIEITE
jgi:hypothetical protein